MNEKKEVSFALEYSNILDAIRGEQANEGDKEE